MAKLKIKDDQPLVARPHAADVLDRVLKADYMGGPSKRGWSAFSTYMICDRMFYWSYIMGLRSRKPALALDTGSLAHACLAAHYATGGVETWRPIEILQADFPALCDEVRRLLLAYFNHYGNEDAQTWDVRAVEHEVVGSMKGRADHGAHKGEVISAPVSCRFDLLVREKTAGSPSLPHGPCPDGVWICDHKFMARMSRDLVEGFGMDGQFLLMHYLWKQKNLDKIFGPLRGYIINIVTKTKDPECKRLHIVLNEDDIERFTKTLRPIAVEVEARMRSPHKTDAERWPMNFAVCKSPKGFGLCSYWEMCSSHGKLADMYEVSPWGAPKRSKKLTVLL